MQRRRKKQPIPGMPGYEQQRKEAVGLELLKTVLVEEAVVPEPESSSRSVDLLLKNKKVRRQFAEQMFRTVDVNQDGKLQFEEASVLVNSLCVNAGIELPAPVYVESVFRASDLDHNRWLSISEFDRFLVKIFITLQRDAQDIEVRPDMQLRSSDEIRAYGASQMMTILIKIVGHFASPTISVDVGMFDTILELKMRVQKKIGLDLDHIRLIFMGKLLRDEGTVSDYQISEGKPMHLALPPPPDPTADIIMLTVVEVVNDGDSMEVSCATLAGQTSMLDLDLRVSVAGRTGDGKVTWEMVSLRFKELLWFGGIVNFMEMDGNLADPLSEVFPSA